jgi:acyl dehydratase
VTTPLTPPPPGRYGPVTRTDIVRYQGASGDFQPIHHDEPFAREAGYDAPLSVGMLQAGLLATWATDWLGPENVRRFRVRFKEQVWPGDVLVCSGSVAEHRTEGGEDLVDLELVCEREGGGVAIQGWATFVVP